MFLLWTQFIICISQPHSLTVTELSANIAAQFKQFIFSYILYFLYKCNTYVHYIYFSIVRVLKLYCPYREMLNSSHEHESFLLRSNSYKRVPQCRCPSASLVRAQVQNANCTMTLSSSRAWHVIPWSSGLLAGRGAPHCCSPEGTQKPTPSAASASLEGLCVLFSLLLISGPSLRQSDVHRSSSSKPLVSSPLCASPMAAELLSWPGSADVTYKPAAGCESETHSRRVRLPCGLQANAGKTLFWQGSHLLPSEGQGLAVGCPWAKSQRI